MCGIFGIFNHEDASTITALSLHSLQHRGQEACGIVTHDKKNFYLEKRLGLVGDNFTKKEVIEKLPGSYAIGHNRYATTGETVLRNVQPFFADLSSGRHAHTGVSSLTYGYSACGYNAAPAAVTSTNTIEKYSVTTDSDATDVGDASGAKWFAPPVGSQV